MNSQVRFALFFVVAVALATALFFLLVPIHADILYVNGRIYTVNPSDDVAEALATRGERIVAVGGLDELRSRVRARQIIDLQGKTVVPGFIDAHAHFMSLGLSRLTVDLTGTLSEADAAAKVAERVKQSAPGQWIRGRGWDQNDWPVKRFPTHASLDRVAPNNPVYLNRIDGHACWVNKRAMEIAGISRETPDPPGGRIIRDAAGNPTGVFVDAAMDLVASHLPPLTDDEANEAMATALHECLKNGITGIHDMGVDLRDIELFKRAIDENRFPFRIYAAIGGLGETWEYFLKTGPIIGYRNKLTIRAIKLYMDGALGSRGAALIEPYSDDPENRGLTLMSESDFQGAVEQALRHGFQVCTHAIGDRGNNLALNGYEAALKALPVADHRLRIEHAQVLDGADIPRFKQLGVLPSMQPTHCTSDMYWAEARLGPDRVRRAYAWRSLLNTGTIICGGSDFPVEDPNPILGIYAAVSRQDLQGRPNNAEDVRKWFQLSQAGITDEKAFEGGWYADQRMTRQEALRAFTIWAAHGAFEETMKGSLEPGKLADFVVLSDDLMSVPTRQLPHVRVLMTIVGGRTAYTESR